MGWKRGTSPFSVVLLMSTRQRTWLHRRAFYRAHLEQSSEPMVRALSAQFWPSGLTLLTPCPCLAMSNRTTSSSTFERSCTQ